MQLKKIEHLDEKQSKSSNFINYIIKYKGVHSIEESNSSHVYDNLLENETIPTMKK